MVSYEIFLDRDQFQIRLVPKSRFYLNASVSMPTMKSFGFGEIQNAQFACQCINGPFSFSEKNQNPTVFCYIL